MIKKRKCIDNMDGTLFNYLFEGAKSSKQERVEDFVTELMGFMWELDPSFKAGLISYLKQKICDDNLSVETSEFLTQEIVLKSDSDTPFRYDIVLETNTKKKVIIENKIDSKDNQFLKYLKSKSHNEIMLLLIPKKYEQIKDINNEFIIYWEDLILHLKKFLTIESENNNTLKQIRKSFFNYLFDYAGLYYDLSRVLPNNFLLILKKHIKNKNQKKTFLKYKSLFPFGFHIDAPYFGIEITDFFDKSIELILEDNITKLKEDKKEHKEEIKILNSEKYAEEVVVFEKEESDNSFFNVSLELNNNFDEIEKYLIQFIKDFYENQFAEDILEELKNFLKLIKKLILISGSENEFKDNIIKYYIFLKDNLG